MVDVDGLTDAELRTKLIEYGFPVMPITGTTRKVMAKKLKILMENKNKVNNDGRRSLGRYSSEEESDADVKLTKRDKNRRITMAAPVSKVPVRKSHRKVDNDTDAEQQPPPKAIITEEKKVTSRTTKIMKMAENDFDTGSDTDTEVIESSHKTTYNNHEYKASPKSGTGVSSFLSNVRNSPPKVVESTSKNTFSTPSPSRYTSYGSPASTSDYASDRLNQIRSRLSLSTANYDRPMYSPSSLEKEDDNAATPFLSNFTRRLSQLSSNVPQKSDNDIKNDIFKEHDTNGSGSYQTRSYLSRPIKRDFVRDYHHQTGKSHFKNNFVSYAVIFFTLFFFVALAILYMGLHTGQTDIDALSSGLVISYCDRNNKNHKHGVNCILDTDLREAVDMYKLLKPELERIAIEHQCTDSSTKMYMTESDTIRFGQKYFSEKDPYALKSILGNMEILALSNPTWDISVFSEISAGRLSKKAFIDAEELDVARQTYDIALAVVNPTLPWKCTFYNKISAVFHIVLMLGITFLIFYGGNTVYKYYNYHQQKQKDELFYMVERIIDTLQTNATDEGDNYMVINHVRDMIIRINDRSRMDKIWKKAVKFINENESRVRTEMQVVQGEPYEVWRWLGSASLNASGARNKSWQGQAFETQVGSVNSLPYSPTPCLKIRGMVDDGDRNLHTIKEAVLSKCAQQCRILHCAVDTTSQCVYLKCVDQNDAAIAYRSLHGWWYAGNLVTVKYLRLERYMQRYPDSPVNGPPYLKAVQPAADWNS